MKEQTMKKQYITFAFVLAHTWVLMIFFGALVFDTLIVYPNTFHDVPHSLERAMAFATVRGPGDFFPPGSDRLRRTVLDGLLLAPEHDHVHGRLGDPFRRFPEADSPGIRGGTLDTVRAGRGCGSDLVHGGPEIPPVQDLVPVCSSRGASSRWRTLECLNRCVA
jgi:hypothetical protein